MKDTLECIDNSLKLLGLEGINWLLGIPISTSIDWAIESSSRLLWRFEVKGNNILLIHFWALLYKIEVREKEADNTCISINTNFYIIYNMLFILLFYSVSLIIK